MVAKGMTFDGTWSTSYMVLEALQLPNVERLSFRECREVDLENLELTLYNSFRHWNLDSSLRSFDLSNCTDIEGQVSFDGVARILLRLQWMYPNATIRPATCKSCDCNFVAADSPQRDLRRDLSHAVAITLSIDGAGPAWNLGYATFAILLGTRLIAKGRQLLMSQSLCVLAVGSFFEYAKHIAVTQPRNSCARSHHVRRSSAATVRSMAIVASFNAAVVVGLCASSKRDM
ncbi:hypothetical protein M427DRAFT_58452 [Gonapodya prolifera JEL478]|uniref:Uncharacterized protein n=1 Tax=Gonapodya prolifera (strain JEL478) TaxID=1344416 RepID=A0A139AA22_GONPJ|nr:hypothetical protein M427DRAFT_58452 [Gonapodya prolifera JEL478]|eukprot:KXS13636.1 hypothetical protein M427DRAFT_58452 [Gonapodya prolifera JEL478]